MRILLTNDDGIHAPGLAALERIARALSDDVWVCAPEIEQSGKARSLTLSEPLRVRTIDDRHFAVLGTPTDCVMLAVQELIDGEKPGLVLSGVNYGLNAGEDVTMSGTVAGAMEGMALGIPSIALSQVRGPERREDPAEFQTAETFGADLVTRLLKAGWPADVILNINFPIRPPDPSAAVEVTRQGFRDVRNRYAEHRTDLRGRSYYWVGYKNQPSQPTAGTDLRAAYDGRISVTPLHIDLTHADTIVALASALAEPSSVVGAVA